MRKSDVLKIIDDVMNNREIDSIRNAILAIRDKVIETPEDICCARLPLRGNEELWCYGPYFEGAAYFCVDTFQKNDSGSYGGYWYE